MKKIIFACCLVVSISFSYVYAAEVDASQETLSNLLKNMHSFKANFTQTILDKHGKAVQTSKGQMQLLRPNQFRWDVTSPSKQLIVTNGKKIWIYDPDLDQVTIRSLVKAAGETPAMLLSNENLALGDEFAIKPLKIPSSDLNWFLLTPKDKGTVISSLRLGFAAQQIKQMQIKDHLGHTTMIEFNQAKMNLALSSSVFNFKPPAHIDIIDETKSKH